MFISTCKTIIESIQRLLRCRPYKLMNIVSFCKSSYFFKDISFFQFCRKIKINPSLHSSKTCSFHVQLGELNPSRGYARRYRPYKLMNFASSYKKIRIFFKVSHFCNFQEKSKIPPPPPPLQSFNICSFHMQKEN